MAAAMVRLSIGPQLDRLAADPDPDDVFRVLAVDPACGAAVFLVAAARFIAGRYGQRLMGPASPLMMRLVMPDVISECIFGMDRDPIAVNFAKAALWIELDGERPLEFLDRNLVCCDALSGPARPAAKTR